MKTKKGIAKDNMERFGRVIFKRGIEYKFIEDVTPDGGLFYRIKTFTGIVEFLERDFYKFFVVDKNQDYSIQSTTETPL